MAMLSSHVLVLLATPVLHPDAEKPAISRVGGARLSRLYAGNAGHCGPCKHRCTP